MYEAQRQNMQREIDDLRAQSAKLADDLAEREQLILRKDATRSWRSPDQGAILGKLDAAQKAEQAAREETCRSRRGRRSSCGRRASPRRRRSER